MYKTLSLDIGTNSIGWAATNKYVNNINDIENGVVIFSDPVADDNKATLATERRNLRQARRQSFRKKMRKITLLKILSKNMLAPVTLEEIDKWQNKNLFPVENDGFINWIRMRFDRFENEDEYHNVYKLREIGIYKRNELSAYELGRIFYHFAQKRGFKSARRSDGNDEDIKLENKLDDEYKKKHGDKFLIEILMKKLRNNERIREGDKSNLSEDESYTRHQYIREFDKIIEMQNIDNNIAEGIKNIVFFQRKLKSQKGLIAKCKFEPTKKRCYKSHPEFEEYRLLQKINNIKKKPKSNNVNFTFLSDVERIILLEKMTNIKDDKKFGDLKKHIDKNDEFVFNYNDDTKIDGCPTIKTLKDFFGENYYELKFEHNRNKRKTTVVNYEDVWHILNNKEDGDYDKIQKYAKEVFGFDDKTATKFAKVKLKSGYSDLSLKAIRNILPFLKMGYRYDKAVMMAKIPDLLGEQWSENMSEIINNIEEIFKTHKIDSAINFTYNSYIAAKKDKNIDFNTITNEEFEDKFDDNLDTIPDINLKKYYETELEKSLLELKKNNNNIPHQFKENYRISDKIAYYLKDRFNLDFDVADILYHPSEVEIFPVEKEGKEILPKPVFASIKNPLFIRTMSILRKLITKLYNQNIINEKTTIIIETTRQLNSRNAKNAIAQIQNSNEKKRSKAIDEIKKLYLENCKKEIEPNDTDITKFLLWEEQNKKCIYTGKEIRICDLFSKDNKIQIEHTVPQSLSFDNSMSNKTICFTHYNNHIKGNKLPAQLPNYEVGINQNGDIYPPLKESIEFMYNNRDKLKKELEKIKKSNPATPEGHDKLMIKKYKAQDEFNYWNKKIKTFEITEVDKKFLNSQLVDTSIIAKYAINFLKKKFDRVIPVKASIIYELKNIYLNEKKDRSDHLHHTVDALFMALASDVIRRRPYALKAMSNYYETLGDFRKSNSPTIKNKLDSIKNEIIKVDNLPKLIDDITKSTLVYHYHKDRTFVQTKKKVRIRGKIQYKKDDNGNKTPLYQQGFGVRGELHSQLPFGKIVLDNQFKYVQRKPVTGLKKTDIKKIVDPAVREIIENNFDENKTYYEFDSKTPIKKVRMVGRFQNLMSIRTQTFKSEAEYKNYNYVINSGNYAAAYYENPETLERDFELISLYDYTKYKKNQYFGKDVTIPYPVTKNGAEVKYFLKRHTKVLVYEKSPQELLELDKKELYKRLYYVLKFHLVYPKYLYLVLKHHIYAESKIYNNNAINVDSHKKTLFLPKKEWNFIVENEDFKMDMLGNIEFLDV